MINAAQILSMVIKRMQLTCLNRRVILVKVAPVLHLKHFFFWIIHLCQTASKKKWMNADEMTFGTVFSVPDCSWNLFSLAF